MIFENSECKVVIIKGTIQNKKFFISNKFYLHGKKGEGLYFASIIILNFLHRLLGNEDPI